MTKYLLPLVGVLLLGAGCATESSVDLETANDDLQTEPIMAEGTGAGDLDDDMIDADDEAGDDEGSEENVPSPEPSDDDLLSVSLSMNMKSGNFFFDPSVITAKSGQEVNITFTENAGFHTFVIDSINLKETISANGTVSFTAPTTPGRYEFYCDVGSHAQLGMKGTLVVQ